MDILKTAASIALQLVFLLLLIAGAFLAGCATMLKYRGPVKFRRFQGGPFRGQHNLGAYRPSDLYLTLAGAGAIANATRRVGPRRGPDWPVGHPAERPYYTISQVCIVGKDWV